MELLYASLILLVLAMLGPQSAVSLSCVPCEIVPCPEPPACKGGLTLDVCGCCNVCAKTLGEACGGPFGITGACDRNLECYKEYPDDFNADGICVPTKPECSVQQKEYLEQFNEWKMEFAKWKRGGC